MRTLSQKRSKYALEKVLEFIENNNNSKEEFASFVSGCPTQILQNGFGQSIAFWMSKSKNENKSKHKFIVDTIKEWLSYKNDDIQNSFLDSTNNSKEFIEKISSLNQNQYLSAQKETLKLLEWIKRYAQAFKGD